MILFIHREERYDPRPDNAGIAEIIVAKQRNGPTGSAKLAFRDHLVRFDNLSRDAEPSTPERVPYGGAQA